MSTFAKLDPNYAIMNNCDPCTAGKASSMASASQGRSSGFVTQSAQIASSKIPDSYEHRLNSVVAAMASPTVSAHTARAAATGYVSGVARVSGPQY